MTVILKAFGIILLSLCGFFVGFEKTTRIKNRMLFWKELDKFLSQTKEAIRYRALSLPQLFAELQKEDDYHYLNLSQQTSFQLFQFPDYISPQEKLLFAEFFKTIGQTTTDSLCEQIEYYLMHCKRTWTELEKDYKTAIKLYPKAYLCIGLLFGLSLL